MIKSLVTSAADVQEPCVLPAAALLFAMNNLKASKVTDTQRQSTTPIDDYFDTPEVAEVKEELSRGCCRCTTDIAVVDDFWNRRNQEQKENTLYSLMNINGKGRVIDVYRREGEASLRRLLRSEVAPFLYNGGRNLRQISYHELQKMAVKRYFNNLMDEKHFVSAFLSKVL